MRNGAALTNNTSPGGTGNFGTPPNTIELTVDAGGQVIATGTSGQAEAMLDLPCAERPL